MLAQMMKLGQDGIQNGSYSDRYLSNHPMMLWMGSNSNAFWFFGILWLVTWILIIAVLIALLRWLWKKGDPERGRR